MNNLKSASQAGASSRPRTILVVDDEPAVVRTIAMALQEDGLAVLSASCLRAAVAAVLNQPVDLVLIDYLLDKDGNGLDLVRQLLLVRPDTPFMLVSGRLTTEITVAAMQLGARNVLEKPIGPDRLKAAVLRALTREQPRRPAWSELDASLPSAERLAALLKRAISARRDPSTLEALTHHLALSRGTFCEGCRLLKVKAHDARDLARLLRAVIGSGGEVRRISLLLDVRDHRTMEGLLERAGITDLPGSERVSPAEFLRRQQFIPFEHDVVQALLVLIDPDRTDNGRAHH